MNDIKYRRQKSVKGRRGNLPHPRPSDARCKADPVKVHVTPPSTLMVQEILSLQLRFLGQRRGQAYSESKSPSHTLHITRFISSSDPHRKRIRHIRLHVGLPGNGKLECPIERWDYLGQDIQRHRPQL